MTADLHIHTTASDGHCSPHDIIQQAITAGLTHIAITDHDTVDGIIALQKDKLYPNQSIVVIPGIEFSADLPGREVHMLGYYIDPFCEKLQKMLSIIISDRDLRIKKMIEKVQLLGYGIKYEDILGAVKHTTALGRPHLAKALVKKGYFSNVAEVFNLLLSTDGPAYVPHYKLEPEEIIKLIHECGGIAVLAHPGLIHDDGIVHKLINQGIQGLEVYHPKHSDEETERYAVMAESHKLLVTGGSDFHAISSRFPNQLGMFTVKKSLAEKLLLLHTDQK